MNNFGYFKVGAFVPEVRIADVAFNSEGIIKGVKKASENNVKALVFPELSVTAYTCADLFHQQLLVEAAEKAISEIAKATSRLDIIFAVGAPVNISGKLYNCAVIISRGSVLGIVPKSYLPNYNEFYEKRWFESGKHLTNFNMTYAGNFVPVGVDLIFEFQGVKIGVEICEDLWVPVPPSSYMARRGADVILNLSASDDLIGKHQYLLNLISQQSARCRAAYVYASAGWGESSTDLVFSGKTIIGEDGKIYENSQEFTVGEVFLSHDIDIEKLRQDREKFNTFREFDHPGKDYRFIPDLAPVEFEEESEKMETLPRDLEVDPYPFVPSDPAKLHQHCREIINIQSYGLMKRLEAIGCKKVVIGTSGGLDSTLALLVAVHAFSRLGYPMKNIIGVTMPGFATSTRTKSNASALMELLGVTSLEIPIGEAVNLHFRDIGQDPNKYDATYENSQARERTQIIMDLANKEGAIVIGTGDMSELALGWCTYNGDQMSMYGVNASVPKTLVRHLVKWFTTIFPSEVSKILQDICDTPISPELVPPSDNEEIGQKTEDLVGPYELHDFFLYNFLRNGFSPLKIYALACKAFENKYTSETILKWLKIFIRRFFSQQFKRSCMPDGPKVGSVNLSPRGDWRMPSDACANLWLKQLDSMGQ